MYTCAGTGAAQQHLLPALMRVYAMADAVVGLDVDRDSFDKFRCCPDVWGAHRLQCVCVHCRSDAAAHEFALAVQVSWLCAA